MARLPVPIVVTVTGEGGSGGALAIAVGDRVNILENSFYSVISPEGCASDYVARFHQGGDRGYRHEDNRQGFERNWVSSTRSFPKPEGGAHTDYDAAAGYVDEVLNRQLIALSHQPLKAVLDGRYEKFRKMGQFFDLVPR
jgi:acetyl-CoA carboxylase carboxyl transferase subunit alpha